MGHGRQPPCSDNKRHPLGNLLLWLKETCSADGRSGAGLTSLQGVDRERMAFTRAFITSMSVSRQTGASFSLETPKKMASEIVASRLSESHRAVSSARAPVWDLGDVSCSWLWSLGLGLGVTTSACASRKKTDCRRAVTSRSDSLALPRRHSMSHVAQFARQTS